MRLKRVILINYSTAQGQIGTPILSLMEDRMGNLWIVTGNGIEKFDGSRIDALEKTLQKGEILPIGIDQGLKKVNGKFIKTFTNYSIPAAITKPRKVNYVYSILEDKLGNMWFGAQTGVCKYDGNRVDAIEAAILRGEIISPEKLQGLKKDKDKLIKTFTNYTVKQGLGENKSWCLLEDKIGNIWFGTNGGGLSCYDGNRVELIEAALQRGETIAPEKLRGLKKQNGKWIKSITNYTTKQGLANNLVYTLTEDKTGNLWIGTINGLSRYDGNNIYNVCNLNNCKHDLSIQKDLNEHNSELAKCFLNYTTAEGLPDNGITQILTSKEPIILGTNQGLAILVAFSSKLKNGTITNRILAQNTLSNKELEDYEPELEIYNSSTGYPIKDINVGNRAMVMDNKGIVWAATGSPKTGLVRFDYSAIHKNISPPKLFIQQVKLKNENICWPNLSKHSSDSVTSSLSQFNTFGKTISKKQLNDQRTRFAGVQFEGINPFYFTPKKLVLPHQHNEVSFEFNAVEPGRPYMINYQYILEGYEKEWSPITKLTSATFGNIHEGKYTFKVKAQGPEGLWSKPITYSFEVLPPWWRTWWMYCTDIILISALLYGIYRWRTASLRKDKERLEKTVEKRTYQLHQEKKETEKQRDLAEKQKQTVQEKQNEILESIHYASRIQLALMPDMDELKLRFPEILVFNMPKDIVSGDFYWFKKLGDYSLLACVDCTGHGVPGAFMSTLGTLLLDKIISTGFRDPSEILNQLSIEINQTLHQNIDKGIQDGMDLSLCLIDHQHKKINFCGARNGIIQVTDGKAQRFKADLFPVGGSYIKKGVEVNRIFKSQEIVLKEGDWIYMYTDGFIEQMGERMSGAPMDYKQFESYLIEVSTNESNEIKEQCLLKRLEEWRGVLARTDDVLIIGFQV